jgi:hypothetical protein
MTDVIHYYDANITLPLELFYIPTKGHVGSTRVGFDGVHGGFGYGSRNQEGEGILNFVLAYDLFVTNTIFRKSLSPSNF